MNNDLEQFSEEYLKELINSSAGDLTIALARIALAAKQAKPVAWEVKGILCHTKEEADIFIGEPEPLYDTPQPAHTERDGWIKCSDRMPEVGDVVITTYQGAINIGEMERSENDFGYFTSIVSGRELPADLWIPLPSAPKPESE